MLVRAVNPANNPVLTQQKRPVTISFGGKPSSHQESPRRLAWPRTSPFHGGNTGSNPVGDANKIKDLLETPFFAGDTSGTQYFFSSTSLCPAASRPPSPGLCAWPASSPGRKRPW